MVAQIEELGVKTKNSKPRENIELSKKLRFLNRQQRNRSEIYQTAFTVGMR